MLSLLIVEDHELVREGLARLLRQLEDEIEILEARDFEIALDILDERGDLDLVLLDLALPGIDGFAGLQILRQRHPAIPVAVVSAFDDLPTVTRTFNHGASGFIPKAFSGEQVLAAVKEVLAGNIFRPHRMQPARIDDTPPVPPRGTETMRPSEIGLTDRQAQVLALMVRGLSNRDIAAQLELTEGTVKIHVTAIFRALGVASRTQAMLAASRYGINFDSVF